MINSLIEDRLKNKSAELYNNYSANFIVVKQMLAKYKKYLPNIADYTILHFMDIIEYLEIIIPKEFIENMSSEECYCVLFSALCIYTGFGLNEDDLRNYIKEKNIVDDISCVSSSELRIKFGTVGSIYLFEKYFDIYEISSNIIKNAILFFMNRMSGNLCNWIDDSSYIGTKYDFIANALTISNKLADLQNRNLDLSYDAFEEYGSNEIKGFVERISVSKVYKERNDLIVEINGSDAVVQLTNNKINDINEKIAVFFNNSLFKLTIDKIVIKHLAENANNIYLNKEIEDGWTHDDHELFNKLDEKEKTFYVDYLSAEFSVTKSLKDFAKDNNAELYGLEFRVKSPKSIYEKLHNRNYNLNKLADVIRYTLILDPKNYVDDINRAISLLEAVGWKTYCLQNYWIRNDIPYNGVNSNLINESGIRAELQYHTKDSFRVKMSDEDHDLYKKRCNFEYGSKEYNEIITKQFTLYEGMEKPKDIETLNDI